MFFFKKKSAAAADLGWLVADMHSHLVPGIDDGAQTLDASVQMIRGLKELGYQKLITTPHVLSDMYPNTPETIGGGAERVRAELAQQGIDIAFGAAAEYYMDEFFEKKIKAREPLLTLSGNLVLVEYSMITAPMDLQELLFDLQMEGYQPVIAHPERYVYLSRRKEFFDELRSAGCLFQLNLLSLTGHYGHSVQELAEYLMKGEFYDYAGTDMHSLRHLELMQKLPAGPLNRLRDSGRIKNSGL